MYAHSQPHSLIQRYVGTRGVFHSPHSRIVSSGNQLVVGKSCRIVVDGSAGEVTANLDAREISYFTLLNWAHNPFMFR